MRRRLRPEQTSKGAPKWMVTFSDLITLVLVFFILLFSMSQIDVNKFKAIAGSLNNDEILEYNSSIVPSDTPKEKDEQEESLDTLLSEIKSYLHESGLGDVIVATRTERGVVLVLEEQVLFQSGDATIRKDAYPFLNKIGQLITNIPHFVKVEGHTDNNPIQTYQYPSNWELSTARASSVIRYLISHHDLDPARFAAVGYGETRPIVPNDTASNLQKNRRVEVIIADPANKSETTP
ncbi:flagellar motor protein MotS [Rossellomorea sp. BNER]|uniref:flagellar motor protein MotS n=1 Tax=Rossellomorea sp. BNER TaxID=2962031 RepID=UPI003AF29549|nr:flagellar motor protein MotB [Rossellomorea sp. BNER]